MKIFPSERPDLILRILGINRLGMPRIHDNVKRTEEFADNYKMTRKGSNTNRRGGKQEEDDIWGVYFCHDILYMLKNAISISLSVQRYGRISREEKIVLP